MDWALPNLLGGKSETGESERCEQVYRETAGFVRSAVYLMGGEQDLDDIVQETFVKVWKNLSRFEGRSSIRTWVYRIAVNTARQHWRGRSRRKESPVERMPEQAAPPVDVETRELIRRGLANLPEEQREVCVLQ
jgi:RNA polymerase sigma-70 factor (ECF subfamily)